MGLTYAFFRALFGGYSESFRAPTPAAQTCADPADPCNLRNSFIADPLLDPIVRRTWEARAWHAALSSQMFQHLNRLCHRKDP